jgi:hypothetical protein
MKLCRVLLSIAFSSCLMSIAAAEHLTGDNTVAGAVHGAPRQTQTDTTFQRGLESLCQEQGWNFWWDGEQCLTGEDTLTVSREKAWELLQRRYGNGQRF